MSDLRVELRIATLPRPLSVIAVHGWFVVFDDEAGTVDRWEVWQDPDRGGESRRHLHRNMLPPDRGVGGGQPAVDRTWFGEEARLLREVLEASHRYPFCDRYRAWPGPNSNTYVAWVLREAGIEHRLDPRAIGRDFLGAPGQTGSPLLGITCRRGIELHLLGFSAGATSGSLVTPFGRLPGRLK